MHSNWGYGIVLFTLVLSPLGGLARTALPALATPPAATKEFDVKVSSASQRSKLSSLASSDVLAVREILERSLLAATDADMVPIVIEDELEQAYPGSVNVRSTMLGYTWVWVEHLMQWVPICSNRTTFDVSLGTTVQVDVEVATELVRR